MLYAVFPSQSEAQSAADSIWAILSPETEDVNAATGDPSITPITKEWAIPYQRLTDAKWVILIHPTIVVSGQANWVKEEYASNW